MSVLYTNKYSISLFSSLELVFVSHTKTSTGTKLNPDVSDKTRFICKQLCIYITLGVTNNPESFTKAIRNDTEVYSSRHFLLA